MNAPLAKDPPKASDDPNAAAVVYFDGGCPICAKEISWYRPRAGGVVFANVDAETTAPAPDLTRAAALARLHARTTDGRLVSGAAAFVALWRTIPALRPIARVLDNRLMIAVLDVAYAGFLRVRKLWR
jgi:predicted DCC family thiol-disulfide oxidoreductase YuxK